MSNRAFLRLLRSCDAKYTLSDGFNFSMNDQMQSDAGFIERVALMLACSNPVYIHSQQLCGSDIKSAL